MDDDSSRSSYSSYRAASSFHHKRQYDSDSDSSWGYTSKSFHQKNDLSQYVEDSDAETRLKSKQVRKKNGRQKRKVVSNDSDDDDDAEATNEVKEQTLYCICRSPRMSQFMIACDNCEEWFHGECVKVTWTYSKKVEKYYCDACRGKNPSLEIVLKEPYASRERAKKEKAARLKMKSKKGRGRGAKKKDTKKSQKESHHRRGKHKTHSDDELDELKSKTPRHCFGPKCINSARKGSKYCSDECGIRLAKDRLIGILPERIADWQKIPCAADKLSQNTLEEIRLEFKEIEANLKEIDVKQAKFDAILERGKRCLPYTKKESEKILESDPDTDYLVLCFCCPQDVPLKGFLKHSERCFNKIEASSTYVSSIEPYTLSQVINRDVFCNFYHPKQGNYCRRLKVLCPEHFKDSKVSEEEVCGCPHRGKDNPFHTENDHDSPGTEEFCRLTRKKCIRHYGWEKVWQGGLDMQRLRLLWKWEELQFRNVKCLNQMNTRHGVLNLLLNKTTIAPDYKIDPVINT